MAIQIVFDSEYGNTERVARAIAEGLAAHDVRLTRIGDAPPPLPDGLDLLVIGSPTQGGRATTPINELIAGLPPTLLTRTLIAPFDTRMTMKFVQIFGYAADRMARALSARGAARVVAPQGFFVEGKEGPLKEGELSRATAWGRQLLDTP